MTYKIINRSKMFVNVVDDDCVYNKNNILYIFCSFILTKIKNNILSSCLNGIPKIEYSFFHLNSYTFLFSINILLC